MPTAYKGQKYSSIRSDCLKKGTLFEDPEFPANNKSIFYSKIDNEIEWKRPKELCKVPKLVVEGVSCDDLNQGELGNTWFVTACSSLALEKKLFEKVIPNLKEQDWDEKAEAGKNTYAGIFHFMFWRFGEWTDVVVDDRLPTKDGKLIFCHSKSRNEFWGALLEKAYAKLYGDYESLSTGRTADALVDFTGGVAEKLVIAQLNIQDQESQMAFFNKLREAIENKSLINCNIECEPSQVGSETSLGLLMGHGYNITQVIKSEISKKHQGAVGAAALYMVRLANPWGTKEWTGAWADGSEEWQKINTYEWEKLGLKFEQEGEFWMSFDDFIKQFTNVDICHFVNTAILTIRKSWNELILHSEWSVAGRNGGSDFNSMTFLSNPQYYFDIMGINDRVMISVEQHDIKPGRQTFGQTLNCIGFQIMKVELNRKFRVHIQGDLVFKSEYNKSRSVFGTCTLKKGRYVIVPTSKDPGETGQFMMRLYTGNKSPGKELVQECPSRGCICVKPHSMVTTLTIEKAEGLELPTGSKVKTLDPFVIVKCEGEKVTSEICANTKDPTWNMKVTFYRKKPEESILLEIINENVLINDYLCEGRVDNIGTEDGVTKKFDLFGKGKEKDTQKPGCIHVNIRSSHDLSYL